MMSEQQRDVPLEVDDKCSESDEVIESLPSCHPGALTPEKLREAEMASTGSEASDSQMPGGTSGRTSPASSTGQNSDASMSTDGDMIITDSMRAEEEKLKQNAEEEQKSQEIESGDSWKTELEEQRYKRLQHLLQKSSIYTNFLLSKMDEQQAKERKRQERQAQKRKEEEKNQKKEKKAEEKKEQLETPKRSRRSARKQDQEDSQESGSSQEGAGKKSSKGKKQNSETDSPGRGRKRKADTYSIADYLNKETLTKTSKKQNVDQTDTAAEPTDTLTVDDDADQTVKASKGDFVDTFSRVINGEKVSDLQPDLFSGGVLRKYQLDGMEWLKVLYENGVNGILGDEMGLGKTIQCIALFAYVIEMGVPGPFLVCAPLSTVPNWVSEFQRFTPKIPVLLYHGTKEERAKKRKQIRKKIGEHQSHPIVITSYEIVMNDRIHLQGLQWKYVIVDEGHRIKNLNCRLINFKELESTLTKTSKKQNVDQTDTAAEPTDTLTVDADADQSVKANKGDFVDTFSRVINGEKVSDLQPDLFSGGVLRKYQLDGMEWLKVLYENGVNGILGDEMGLGKTIQCIALFAYVIEMGVPGPFLVCAPLSTVPNWVSEFQRFTPKIPVLLYHGTKEERAKKRKQIRKKIGEHQSHPIVITSYEIVMNDRIHLQGLQWKYVIVDEGHRIKNLNCRLIKETEELYPDSEPSTADTVHLCRTTLLSSGPSLNFSCAIIVDPTAAACFGDKLDKGHFGPIRGENPKGFLADLYRPIVLIFSQFTTMLDILEDFCHMRSHQYCRLDGTTSLEDRQERMKEFNSNPDVFLFLLSTRAGGLGINLTAADTVIIYDSDWNPQSDLQAQDRCHRIGQTKPVVIYRLVTANTIDQRIVERAAAKRKLEKMVIHQGKYLI
eukprot:XP_011673627.1 PREDICTED: lymphocyte-specific helicase-like [Strongylocentrotus purpuratus]